MGLEEFLVTCELDVVELIEIGWERAFSFLRIFFLAEPKPRDMLV